jgi:galactokinase/mevalonate kinase-like predicted kinase
MGGNTFLQVFLIIQVFILGALVTMAINHYLTHIKPNKKESSEDHTPQLIKPIELPQEAKDRLLSASQAQFEAAVHQSAEQLQSNLAATNGQINELVMRLATDVVSSELDRYKKDLAELQKKTEADMSGISAEVSKHQEDIKAKISQELESEKQKLIKQIDTKLADAVGSFLLEALGHNIDLGSQSSYLLSLLEEHKAEFIKEVGSESQPTG